MPKPTAAPLVLAVGIALAAMGVAASLAFLFVGVVVFVAGTGDVDFAALARPGPLAVNLVLSRRFARSLCFLPPARSGSCATAFPVIACGYQ